MGGDQEQGSQALNETVLQPALAFAKEKGQQAMAYMKEKFPGLANCFEVAIDLAGQATAFVSEKMEQAGAWVSKHYDKLSMAGHLLLDGLGMVPGFGAIADGLNAVWYLAEGNYTDAALSTFAAIPGIGDAAAAAKLGKRASGLGKTFKALDKAGDALSGVKSAASAIGKTVKTSGPAKQMMAAADTARAFVDKVPDGLKQVVARYGNEIEAGAEFSVGTVMELNAAYEQYGDDLTAEQIQQIVLGNALSTTVGYGIGKGINKAADKWLPRGGVDAPNGRTSDVDADTMPSTSTKANADPSTQPMAHGTSQSVESSTPEPKTQTPNVEPNPDVSLSQRDRTLLNESSPKRGDQLSQQELDAERTVASRAERKQINDGDYVEQIDLPNDHEWKKKKDGTWCRHSDDPVCGLEGPDNTDTDRSSFEPEDFPTPELILKSNDPSYRKKMGSFASMMADGANDFRRKFSSRLQGAKDAGEIEEILEEAHQWWIQRRHSMGKPNPKILNDIQPGDPNRDPFGKIEGLLEDGMPTPAYNTRAEIGDLIDQRFSGLDPNVDVLENPITIPNRTAKELGLENPTVSGNTLKRGDAADAIDAERRQTKPEDKQYGYNPEAEKFITETGTPANQKLLHDAGVKELSQMMEEGVDLTDSKDLERFSDATYFLFQGPIKNRGSDSVNRGFLSNAGQQMSRTPVRLPHDVDIQAYARSQDDFRQWLAKEVEVPQSRHVKGDSGIQTTGPRQNNSEKRTFSSESGLANNPNKKAKTASTREESLDEFMAEYRNGFKASNLSDEALKEAYERGDTINPSTGRLNKLDTGKPPFDPSAELSKDEFELGNLKSTPDPLSGIQKVEVSHTQLSQKQQRRLQASAERRKRAQQEKRNVESKYAASDNTFNDQQYDRHEDIPEWKQSHGEMLKASESLGEQAIDATMATQLPNARPIKSTIPGKGGQGQFDRIYVDGDNVYILEGKGAGGRRGGRQTKEGMYAEQGTADYRDDIIENMREYADKADDPELMETVRVLENALDEGTLSYLEIAQRVDKDGKLSQKVDVVRFSD